MRFRYECESIWALDSWIVRCEGASRSSLRLQRAPPEMVLLASRGGPAEASAGLCEAAQLKGGTMPYLVEAADGTVLATAEHTYRRAESTARLYVGEHRVETRVLEWRETAHGPKVRELWCATDYPASVRFGVSPRPLGGQRVRDPESPV